MAEGISDDQFRKLQREIRESIRRNHPNPNRVGCVGTATLRKIAESTLSPSDPAFSHVMECSPCYEELMELTEQVEAGRAGAPRRNPTLIAGAIAAVLLIVGVTVYFLFARAAKTPIRNGTSVVENGTGTSPKTPAPPSVAVAMLNLDSEPSFRGSNSTQPPGTFQRLPRKDLDLTINLRRGMDEGQYEIQIGRANGAPVLSASGRARIENGLTVLRVRVDLSRFEPGQYVLRIRPAGSAVWRESAVVLF
jgi:hypothetical protein